MVFHKVAWSVAAFAVVAIPAFLRDDGKDGHLGLMKM